MKKVLVLSTVDFHYEGHGWSWAEKLRAQGHDVCFMCLEKSMPDTEYFFFDKHSRFGFQNIRRILYNNIDGIILHFLMKAESLYGFQTSGLYGISANKILEKCPFVPDVIYITWTARFITPKTVRDLFNKTGAKIVFPMVDEAILSACHFPGNCRGYENGCKKCPGVRHFKVLPRRVVRMKEKYWTDMPAEITGTMSDIQLCKSVSFLKHKEMTGVVLVPNTEPIYSKQDSRSMLKIPEDDFVIFVGANNILEKRKGVAVLIEAVNRLVEFTKGERRITLLIIGNIKGPFPYSVSSDINLIIMSFLPKTEFFKAYYACDVYASPTLADSGPMMVNYAISCGRPVVAFPVGCALDLVITGKTGYMAKYGDPEDFAKGLLYFYKMKSPELYSFELMCKSHIAQFTV